MLKNLKDLSRKLDLNTGRVDSEPQQVRRLSDLVDFFADKDAANAGLQKEDPVIYKVSLVEPADGPGDMYYGLGWLAPGKIAGEYYFTKGHFHEWREAAEVYIALKGRGRMLLEHEQSGESRLVDFNADSVVYVPGYAAHRTINVGDEPLVYLGIYPAAAGHDYGAIADRNFKQVVIEKQNEPQLLDREDL